LRTLAPTDPDERKPVTRLTLPAPAAEEPKTVVVTLASTEPKDEPVKTEAASPVGLWWTEKKESKIRIEACGDALCGYVEGRPNDKVLTNMRVGQNNLWNGNVTDIRSGSTYAAHISLKNPNSLRGRGMRVRRPILRRRDLEPRAVNHRSAGASVRPLPLAAAGCFFVPWRPLG